MDKETFDTEISVTCITKGYIEPSTHRIHRNMIKKLRNLNSKSVILFVLAASIIPVIFTFQQPQQIVQASNDNDGANPYCDKVADNYQDTCHDRFDTDEETGLATCNDGTHKADPQDCKDATNNRGGASTREDEGEFVEKD